MEQYGILVAEDTLRFERILPGPIERVWAYLTESDKRGQWLARGEMELVEGGRVDLQFLHRELSPVQAPIPEKFKGMEQGKAFTGKVLRIDAPHLLSFTWEGGSEVTFELEKEREMVRLTLTHRKLTPEQYGTAPGWHTHLGILAARLQGKTPENFWTVFSAQEKIYTKRLTPAGETGMLIRKPVTEVFQAFVDPAITTKFWFTKSTGRLEKGKTVHWTWEMYNVTSLVEVVDLVPNARIEIEWGAEGKERTRAEWTFRPMGDRGTFVQIVMDGFHGDQQELLEKISGSVGGFCWVLAGCKALLEFDLQLNLIADRFPSDKA